MFTSMSFFVANFGSLMDDNFESRKERILISALDYILLRGEFHLSFPPELTYLKSLTYCSIMYSD